MSWLPAALNGGHTYRDRVGPEAAGLSVCAFYACRYRHSEAAVWRQRLAAGEIVWNGQRLRADRPLAAGDRLAWHRPPWEEAAVPALPGPLFDDGDLVVFNKPSGLPVLPAGGWLEHTVLGQIERLAIAAAPQASTGPPLPVHRLGRFTSGLLLCARRSATRAWLSALLRESTAQGRPGALDAGLSNDATSVARFSSPCSPRSGPCRKTYRALLQPPGAGSPLLSLEPGDSQELRTAIGRRPHTRLGTVWAAAVSQDPAALPAHSRLTLLEPRPGAWLVELQIATGRPHQIRIHAAAAGAPLLGDPLYGPGGQINDQALPGDGGYQLHAHRLVLPAAAGALLELEAPLPEGLRTAAVVGGRDG